MMTKVVNLLRSGAIMGNKFLVSEVRKCDWGKGLVVGTYSIWIASVY